VTQNNKCGKEVTDDGWHFSKCGKTAKYIMQFASGDVLLCGIHAKRYKGDDRLKVIITTTETPEVIQ